jgi:cold shock CspA family protein
MRKQNGKVKFYSVEKGFGFIFDEDKMVDVFFHITEVKGAEPPIAGDEVSFEVSKTESRGRNKALNIEIVAGAAIQKKLKGESRSLQGFPCVRGASISNFVTLENKGKVTAGKPILRWFPAYSSTNDARDALIEKAKALGANAIINYTWHNDRRRAERVFSKSFYFKDNFWAEGEAIVLISGKG